MANETALVIIDMQHDFISLESPLCMREVSKIIPGIKALIAEARKKGWPVIYVIREHDPSGADIEKFRLKYFEKYPFYFPQLPYQLLAVLPGAAEQRHERAGHRGPAL